MRFKPGPVISNLPPIETVQQISFAVGSIAAAIGAGEITPIDGEVFTNVLVAHKGIVAQLDLERRLEDMQGRLERRGAKSAREGKGSGVSRVSFVSNTYAEAVHRCFIQWATVQNPLVSSQKKNSREMVDWLVPLPHPYWSPGRARNTQMLRSMPRSAHYGSADIAHVRRTR